MRIGLDGYPLAEPRTGVGHYTLELARALARISPSDEFELVSPAPFTTEVLDEIERAQLPNLRTSNPKSSSIRGHWWSVGLPIYARRAGFDLFHGTNFDVPLWKKRRSVVTIHDLSALLHPEKHRSRLVRRARLRLPLVARVADMIITPTESVKREVCQRFNVKSEKVSAIHLAARQIFQPVPFAQTAEIRKRLGIEDEFLLFVGTLEPRKNLLTLLKAFEQIVDRDEPVHIFVIGAPYKYLNNILEQDHRGSNAGSTPSRDSENSRRRSEPFRSVSGTRQTARHRQ